MPELFADTYALVEILKANPAYEICSQEELVTSEFNIFELAYAMHRDFGRTDADRGGASPGGPREWDISKV